MYKFCNLLVFSLSTTKELNPGHFAFSTFFIKIMSIFFSLQENQPTNHTIKLSESLKCDFNAELKKLTDKWEMDKQRIEFDTKLMEYKHKLQLDSIGQKLEFHKMGIVPQGGFFKEAEEVEDNEENEEENTNQNALVTLTHPILSLDFKQTLGANLSGSIF